MVRARRGVPRRAISAPRKSAVRLLLGRYSRDARSNRSNPANTPPTPGATDPRARARISCRNLDVFQTRKYGAHGHETQALPVFVAVVDDTHLARASARRLHQLEDRMNRRRVHVFEQAKVELDARGTANVRANRIEHWLKRSSRVSRLTAPEPANHQFIAALVRFDRKLVSLVARHRAASWRKCTAGLRGSRS